MFVYDLPRRHDYNHVLYPTGDRELVFSCHQLEVFLVIPDSKFSAPLAPS